MKRYYKTRKQAEKVRISGESIYYVSGKGYYIVKSSSNKNKDKNNISFAILTALVFIIAYLLGQSVSTPNCQGIGGFVYQEIEWQEQTIGIIEENCRNGLYVDDWSNDGIKELYCYTKECKGEYCKDIIWRSGIYTYD